MVPLVQSLLVVVVAAPAAPWEATGASCALMRGCIMNILQSGIPLTLETSSIPHLAQTYLNITFLIILLIHTF